MGARGVRDRHHCLSWGSPPAFRMVLCTRVLAVAMFSPPPLELPHLDLFLSPLGLFPHYPPWTFSLFLLLFTSAVRTLLVLRSYAPFPWSMRSVQSEPGCITEGVDVRMKGVDFSIALDPASPSIPCRVCITQLHLRCSCAHPSARPPLLMSIHTLAKHSSLGIVSQLFSLTVSTVKHS